MGGLCLGYRLCLKGLQRVTKWVIPGLQMMFKGITKNNGMGYTWVAEDV